MSAAHRKLHHCLQSKKEGPSSINFLRLLTGLALVVGASWASAQTTVVVPYAGANVNLVVPKGYCAISRDDPLGSLHYQLQEEGNKGRNYVALLFADCHEWAKRKANPDLLLHHHGSYLFQPVRGEKVLLPSNITRADIVQLYVGHEMKGAGTLAQDINKRLKGNLAKASVPSPEFQGDVNFGLIDRDDIAAYFGVGGTLSYQETLVRFIGVTSATATRGVPASINLYAPPDRAPFTDLLLQQKNLVRNFIAANE